MLFFPCWLYICCPQICSLIQNIYLFTVYIDVMETFDNGNRMAFCIILCRLSYPRKFVQITYLFPNGMIDSTISAPFLTLTVVWSKDFFLVFILLNFFTIFSESSRVYTRNINMIDHFQHLTAKNKTVYRLNLKSLFAGDCALMACSENDLQHKDSKLNIRVLRKVEKIHLSALRCNAVLPPEYLYQVSLGSTLIPVPLLQVYHQEQTIIQWYSPKWPRNGSQQYHSLWFSGIPSEWPVVNICRRLTTEEQQQHLLWHLQTLCFICTMMCVSLIGLHSHLMAHNRNNSK